MRGWKGVWSGTAGTHPLDVGDIIFSNALGGFVREISQIDDQGATIIVDTAVASLIDPSLVTASELYVDVDASHGISYGASVGGPRMWPFAEGAKKMRVQHDLDWPRFMRLFVDRLSAPVRSSRPD